MDPNAALANVRRLAALERDHAPELADAFIALDEWLSQGGFPPQDWNRIWTEEEVAK